MITIVNLLPFCTKILQIVPQYWSFLCWWPRTFIFYSVFLHTAERDLHKKEISNSCTLHAFAQMVLNKWPRIGTNSTINTHIDLTRGPSSGYRAVVNIARDDPSPLASMHLDHKAHCGLWPQCAVNLDRNLKPKLAITNALPSDRQTDRQTDTDIVA